MIYILILNKLNVVDGHMAINNQNASIPVEKGTVFIFTYLITDLIWGSWLSVMCWDLSGMRTPPRHKIDDIPTYALFS